MKSGTAVNCLVVLCLLALPAMTFATSGQEYREVSDGDSVSLPQDLFFRDSYRVQWWYFTGHLFDASGGEFGYELTFFAVGVQKRDYTSHFGPRNIFMVHLAVTDVEKGRYYQWSDSDTGAFDFAGADDERLKVWVGNAVLEGTMQNMRIMASGDDIALSLHLEPVKPFVLNGDGGYSRKAEESPHTASLYFSCTSMDTEGILTVGGTARRVKGRSWFDREISSRGLGEHYRGWDWFSLRLDDDREIMLYLIRKKDGSLDAWSSGTFVSRDGSSRHLSKDDFSVKVLRHYTSKRTGARYPSRWEISVPSEKVHVTVTPLVADQEFVGIYSAWNYYWEGACSVEGSGQGRAYVEMTGY